MPQLTVHVNVPAVDADGKDHRARKSVDMTSSIDVDQRQALDALYNILHSTIESRYGPTVRVEGVDYKP